MDPDQNQNHDQKEGQDRGQREDSSWPSQCSSSLSSLPRLEDHFRWDFDIWALQPLELAPLSMHLMNSLHLPESFNIDPLKWNCFMSKVETFMTRHNNPYHNYYHIHDVAQTCYVLLTQFEAGPLLLPHEVLSLMVAAYVHDLNHPGLNNAYQVNSSSELATLYNDISVLENHHCSLAFKVLNSPDSDILHALDPPTRRSVRKLMISSILSTDMSLHFPLLDDVATLPPAPLPPSPLLADKDRETLLKALLHVSDISNPAKSWAVSKKWSDLVGEEFFLQGAIEKEEGLAVSPGMDRESTRQDEFSLNFTDFIVAPCFVALAVVLPRLEEVVGQIKINRRQWHDMLLARLLAERQEKDREQISPGTVAAEEAEDAKWLQRETKFLSAVETSKGAAATTVAAPVEK